MTLPIHELEGEAAASAWLAYRRNAAGFLLSERAYAEGLAIPVRVLAIAPPVVCTTLSRSTSSMLCTTAWQGAEVGRNSLAILAVGKSTPVLTCTSTPLLYMHVRALPAGRGRGHVDRLLQHLQSMMPPKSALVAASAACQSWFASLVLLRNGFGCSDELMSADVPFPGESISAGSSRMSYVWNHGASPAEHIEFVVKAERAHRARNTERSEQYADALAGVLAVIRHRSGVDNTAVDYTVPHSSALAAAAAAAEAFLNAKKAERAAPVQSRTHLTDLVTSPAFVPKTDKRRAAQEARSDRHHPVARQALPPGWRVEWRDALKRSYRLCIGPNGERSKTVKGAWAIHMA
jgi:hypothetical protein